MNLDRNTVPQDGKEVSLQTIETEEHQTSLDPRVLSSVMISVKMNQMQESSSNHDMDPQARLLEIIHSQPVQALIDAAQILANKSGESPIVALQEIVSSLQEIDALWTKVLLKEGLNHLNSQYH